MSNIDVSQLNDSQKAKLVESRFASSASIWDIVIKTYERNTRIYENKSAWVDELPVQVKRIMSNRIFPNMEAVINSVIANPPTINMIPGREGEASQDLSRKLERFFSKKYKDINAKETLRMGLRNLYFGRLLVIKPFWNAKINDFDAHAIDPRDIRCSKYAKREQDSEFFIEVVTDNLISLISRFPKKEREILEKNGYTLETKNEAFIENPEVKYKEAWIGDYVIFKYDNIILDTIRNPYWDWDGMLITDEEKDQLEAPEEEGGVSGESRRILMNTIKSEQASRVQSTQKETEDEEMVNEDANGEDDIDANEGHSEELSFKSYNFNYFDQPRKPYIIATILNNENQPIGRTDFITLSTPLQESIDRRKQDIGLNCELANGITKVDAETMTKADAQALAFETKGVIYGKGVVQGVQRETGNPLPQMVYEDMVDSRNEIDNIMAASSAFRGEREGQETKAGRLALIQQSFLRLNELVQVVDFVSSEMFSWFYQLAKINYTEYHYAKWIGKDDAVEILDVIRDDFETGSEIVVVPGKSLPVDAEFKFERAQEDVKNGFLSPVDYMLEAGYMNAKELSKNAVMFKQNPAEAVGIETKEMPVPFQPGGLTPEQVAQGSQQENPGMPPMPEVPPQMM